MTDAGWKFRAYWIAMTAVLGLQAGVAPVDGQWVRGSEQFYLPASHNWVFRQNYIGADRLFNAFDYGHAILYETLYRYPDGPVDRLEERQFEFLTERLLKRPPRVALEEGAVEIAYAKLAPEAKLMFEWAHVLHRQLYDVLADESLPEEAKDVAVEELLAYYRSRPDLAISSVPKSMEIMDGQFYSLAFRNSYPKFNGLIWAYHWLQIGLYEPLLVNDDVAGRTAGVTATVGRFWQMLEDPPGSMPHLMPMSTGVAPTFALRFPQAAVIFDNLHMMHDVISDILASPDVARDSKRAEILAAAEMFRDDTSHAVSLQEWTSMGEMMGLNNMGGRAVGFTAELPQPTVARGASMAAMEHAAEAAGSHTDHAAVPLDPAGAADPGLELLFRLLADPAIETRIHSTRAWHDLWSNSEVQRLLDGPPPGGTASAAGAMPEAGLELLFRLLSDPEVEAGIHSDPTLHELWSDSDVQRLLNGPPPGVAAPTPARQ